MALRTYFDFAEDDYQYFIASYHNGLIANSMGANAQNICEKYLKHLISKYAEVTDEQGNRERESVMRTHSLYRLLKYVKTSVGMEFSEETKSKMKMIDGFYFTCRYPGDDSIEMDRETLGDCFSAIEGCRSETMEFIKCQEMKVETPIEKCVARNIKPEKKVKL